MELLKANYLDTTTMLSILSGTDTAAYLFDRDTTYQYVTSGYNGTTAMSLRINFDSTLSVSRIALVGHNLKSFVAYYNGATASTFTLISGATTVSNFATNSETSLYLQATPVDCTSVSIDLKEAMVSGSEKAIGYLVISSVRHEFERVPPSKGYKPKLIPMVIKHQLSDGGTRIQKLSENFDVQLTYKHVGSTEKASLLQVWRENKEMIFVPFGTTTSWDQVIFPCVWEGGFDFYEYSDDAVNAGFTGKIHLQETPR